MDQIVEDFVPYHRSVLWQIHDLYYARRGVAAFTEGEIPSRTTTNAALGRQYAELVIAIAAARRGNDELTIVEIGSGSGQLAANVMASLEQDCGEAGRRVYARTRYVLSDFQPATVTAAAATPAARPHVERGRIVPALFDFRRAAPPRPLAGGPLERRPAIAIANYVACVGPTTYLRRTATGIEELCVQLRISVGDPARMPASPAALVEMYRADRELTLDNFERRFEWRPVAPGGPAGDPLHARVLARLFEGGNATLTYPYGFFDLVCGMESWLAPGGIVLSTDYGYPQRAVRPSPPEPRPASYGDSLNHAVQFATLDAFAQERGWRIVRTDAPLRYVEHFAMAKGVLPSAVIDAFTRILAARQDGSDLLDHVEAARLLVKANDHLRAARFYARAAALDPRSVEIHYEMGEACINAGKPAIAIDYLTRAEELDPDRYDYAFWLGRACYDLDRHADAIEHYERSMAKEPHHATWWNLALCHRALGDLDRTRDALDRALALDPTYEPARTMADELRQGKADVGPSDETGGSGSGP